ncbi:hypothetical protein AVEN_235159-1 [Araneus ventricosus]|uniref:Uncharacterized protein n=1 Tax=Araneus ventricosus TaxID=182803 RepID=A0A4Y2H5U3_ARAVE|nr:hypothetical protein AVEN_235159-1 [Araneus ventricosus]
MFDPRQIKRVPIPKTRRILSGIGFRARSLAAPNPRPTTMPPRPINDVLKMFHCVMMVRTTEDHKSLAMYNDGTKKKLKLNCFPS